MKKSMVILCAVMFLLEISFLLPVDVSAIPAGLVSYWQFNVSVVNNFLSG